ncbi:Na+/H+ antiporter [Chryseobacterium pennipullorum]|uniref:Na+/H+ antiporter n=1 Tax=Chryseobacterium pennipullorum TaxID=2258963 RepID=A0A3D9AVD8_9FLAO|nr:Na+/H+ antiporter [Chryseobacterium pennipullorum]REC45311.1 Na+/H+ antiporter [Chryseobacterium pennipullorum]
MAELEKIIWISIILLIIISVKDRIKPALPIVLVSSGLVLSLTGIIPPIDMSPEIIFYAVLPPILFDAAWNTSIPDFKKELPVISVLAIGLVFLTTTIVAVIVHFIIPGFTWPLSFVLGAIISPPDAVAATGITKNFSLPQRLTTILEGESLLNDASALIAYKCAVIAIVSGMFSFWDAGVQFIGISLGGILIGVGMGAVFLKIHRYFNGHSNAETFAVILLPFAAYSLAEHLGCSGVLTVVVLGMLLSWNSFTLFSAGSRIQMSHFWEVIIFILNGLIFLILGMQLPTVISKIPYRELPVLILHGFFLFAVLVVIRFAVLALFPVFSHYTLKKKNTTVRPSKKDFIILSWSGMRGVVSLAAALALPVTDASGAAIGQRNTILFLSFVVIIFTLVIQGLTLPKLISRIKPVPSDKKEARELDILLLQKSIFFLKKDQYAHIMTENATKTMIEKLTREEMQLLNTVEENPDSQQTEWKKKYFDLELQLVEYQRKELMRSYHKGEFSLETVRKKEWELDFWTATVCHEMDSLQEQIR